jgi:hypothetical protein
MRCPTKRKDCCGCVEACIEYPGYEHINGRPFCVKEFDVEVLALLQREGMEPGYMRPKRTHRKKIKHERFIG